MSHTFIPEPSLHPQNDHPPSPRWGPSIRRIFTHNPHDGYPLYTGGHPLSVIHHHMDGHQRSTEWSQPSLGRSPSIPRMSDGRSPSPGWSPTNKRMATPHSKDSQQSALFPGRSLEKMGNHLSAAQIDILSLNIEIFPNLPKYFLLICPLSLKFVDWAKLFIFYFQTSG